MTVLLILATVVLIALNAFFVMGEYALVRSRRSRMEALREEGKRGARLALQQMEDIGAYISASQVGITFASIGIGALGEPALAHALEPVLGGPLAHGVAVVIAALVAYAIITSFHIVFGEIVPKLLALDRAEALARRIARPFRFFRILFAPVIAVLTGVSNGVLRVLGVNPDNLSREGGTPDEIKALIAESYQVGTLDEGEAGMLVGVFHLHEQEARQVMTPIPAVVTVDVSEDVQTALIRGVESGHTRLLVTEDFNPNRLRGIVRTNALARRLVQEGPAASIEPLVRDAPIVPETKPLDDLLAELQRVRTELAVVADEYGRVVGIVTVEDIVEEIVGEIEEAVGGGGGGDDGQPRDRAIRRLPNGDFFVRGHVPVSDLADYGVELPTDDSYNSIGGLVFDHLGRLPKRGDVIDVDGYSIRVESVRENRVEAVRIRARAAPAAPAEDDGEVHES
jgi:CBS domain containing-hemolysin-like protein